MATQSLYVKRLKRKVQTSQNPLFEKWLKEWKDEAASKGSEMQYCFNKALKSLQKFPIKLYSGKECMMLENFGAKLCQKLDDRLEAYKASNPEDLSVYPSSSKERYSNISSVLEVTKLSKKRKSYGSSPVKKKKVTETDLLVEGKTKSSSYVPAYRSGGYAILMAMLEKLQDDNFKGYLSRTEIETQAEEYCDSSFKKPLPGSYYTAWSSMSVLIRKKLVNKEGKPARFSLTQDGIDLAVRLNQVNKQLENCENSAVSSEEKIQLMTIKKSSGKPNNRVNDEAKTSPYKTKDILRVENLVSPVKKIQSKAIPKSPTRKGNEVKTSPCKRKDIFSEDKEPESVSTADETVFMLPGTFEIVLLVDTQERDEKFQQSDGMTMRQLKSRNVNFEIRHLKVGDFIWIARDLHNGFELVLPYIVERKRMDDLGSSIKDGRFHEQKFRLKQSGIENLIYLVEKYGNENQRLGLPLPTLMQAVSNTQVIEGFTVRITNNHEHSMRYLDCMTSQLSNLFKSKTLMSCKKSNLSPANLSDDLISLMTFQDFNKGSEKNKRFKVITGSELYNHAASLIYALFGFVKLRNDEKDENFPKVITKKITVRNMLVKHLVQLNGVSVEKAQAIVQLYPTPKALMEGLIQGTGEKSIADLTCGNFNRSIGPATAKQLRMLYTSLVLN